MTKKILSLLAIVAIALPVLAKAPEALTVFVNGYRVTGKALWYKGRIYVPLEDVANSTNGHYNYDPSRKVASASIGSAVAGPEQPAAASAERPFIEVVWEKKYTTGNNARVVATLTNQGSLPARDLEAICIFKDSSLQELTSVTRPVGTLGPGQTRTVEFQLFNSQSPTQGEIAASKQWNRISYELRFNYN